MARVAVLIRDSGLFTPFFYFDQCDCQAASRLQDACRNLGIAFAGDNSAMPPPMAKSAAEQAASKAKVSKPRKFRPHLRIPLLSDAVRLIKMLRAKRKELRWARETLSTHKPVLLAVTEDGVGGPVPLVHTARRLGIPVLVIPYEFSTLKQPVLSIRSGPRHKDHVINSALRRWVAARYPSWALTWEEEPLLRLPAMHVLSFEWLKMAPPQPWAVHGGEADRVAVESPAMQRHYLSLGMPPAKLTLTGALSDDNLYQHMLRRDETRRALFQELGWAEDSLFLLCSLPPDYTGKRQEACFSNYRDQLTFWIHTLRQLGRFKVLYQLHPAVTDAEKNFVASLGVPVTTQDPAALIPCCDLFITSVSSIIRWAIACGKPVINFDVYRFDYDDYRDVPGVLTVNETAAFEAEISKLTPCSGYLQDLTDKQRASVKEWGMLDGSSGSRMLEIMQKLTNAHPGRDKSSF
jgi:hypothetical protein